MSASGTPHDWDESYAAEAPPPWDVGHPQKAFERLAGSGRLEGDVLDAGCGTGEHTILAARHGARAVGVDISPRAVDAARRKAAERRVDARFEVGDLLAGGVAGESFDHVIDSGLFHTFEDADRPRYVAALHAALRPRGHLYLMCFSDRQPGDWGPRRISETELRAAFSGGWRIEALEPDHFEISPGFGTATVEAWLADIVKLDS